MELSPIVPLCMFLIGIPILSKTSNLCRPKHLKELYPQKSHMFTLHLNEFRRQPANSRFDSLFTPSNSSSDAFAATYGLILHFSLEKLRFDHSKIILFRVLHKWNPIIFIIVYECSQNIDYNPFTQTRITILQQVQNSFIIETFFI